MPKPTFYTYEQRAEYRAYHRFLATPEGRGFPRPKDMDDYFANREKWRAGQYGEEYPVEPPVEPPVAEIPSPPPVLPPSPAPDYPSDSLYDEYQKWALPPEEQARRREESYALTQYGRKEAYREQPRYFEPFAKWIKGQTAISQALRGYVEDKYSSLRARHEADLPPLTGFPTREEARAEAARRESAWEAWLPSQLPDVRQDYYAQRPAERGERYWVQSPTLRTVAW